MVKFSGADWVSSLIAFSIFAMFIIIPCILLGIIGFRTINKMGYYPSQSAQIQFGVIAQLLVVEVLTIGLLTTFYHVFSQPK